MKIIFIGCVKFSTTPLSMSLELLRGSHRPLIQISSTWAKSPDRPASIARWIGGKQPDVIFCFGWSYLLNPTILSIPRLDVIGYHPSLLPANRGRHPIIWAISLRLKQTGSTFFVMDEGADSGAIVSQQAVPIGDDDDAASLYGKLESVARSQVVELARRLADGIVQRTAQNPGLASSWRKRSKDDGRIDWRMPSRGIDALVRALNRPYPCALPSWRQGYQDLER